MGPDIRERSLRLNHIGIGRTHAGTHVTLIIQDLGIRVVNPITGEILRDLTLDPNRDYQPRGTGKDTHSQKRHKPNPQNGSGLSPIS